MAQDKPYSLLVVEDDERLLRLIAHVLDASGFQIRTAREGNEALALVSQSVPDLILSDINMPEVDGFAFRDRLLREPATRSVPFIFLTARDAAEDQIRGLRSGVDEYITKPFVPAVLVARVESVLKRHKAYTEMAEHDPLTGLLNRQAVERDVTRELLRLERYDGSGALIFIDLDDFKGVNDHYGHAAGDEVLMDLANLLREQTRSVDITGRFGGEEFVAYFPENTAEAAAASVERLLKAFRRERFTDHAISVTFSAGVAEALAHGREFNTLCRHADQAMYRAKQAGKDRIVIWDPSMED